MIPVRVLAIGSWLRGWEQGAWDRTERRGARDARTAIASTQDRVSRGAARRDCSELGFVRLRGEAQRVRHTDEAGRRNYLRFPVRRGVRINVADLELKPDGADSVTECQAGFSIPGSGIRRA